VSSPTPESRLAELARKATPGERKVTEQFVDWGFRTLMYVHVGPAAEEYDEAHVICWTRGGAAQCLGSDLKERALTDRARANMDFIAACDPATILRLVEENGRMRERLRTLGSRLSALYACMTAGTHSHEWRAEIQNMSFYAVDSALPHPTPEEPANGNG
jgi:hypothetical protein